MLVFLAMMWIFRPRREWPEFYGVGLEAINFLLIQDNLDGNPAGRANRMNLVAPILTFEVTNKIMFDFEVDPATGLPADQDKNGDKVDYEDDCLARRDSRLSLMSKHLLGLHEEDLEHTDFQQAAYFSREPGLSSLSVKDPILILNPSQVSQPDYLNKRVERMTNPEDVDEPPFDDDNAMNMVVDRI